MSRIYCSERESRSEKQTNAILNFIDAPAISMKLILYSSEVKRLKKAFPQLSISKGDPYRPHLYICTVTRK